MNALLYPLLVSVAVPLALAAQNLDQGIQPSDLALPIILATFIAAAADILSRTFGCDQDQRSLIATSIVILAYTPSILGDNTLGLGTAHLRGLAFLIIAALGAVVAGLTVRLTRAGSEGLSRFMFFLSSMLCVWQVVHLASGWFASPGPDPTESAMSAPVEAAAPDIWLIVLDAYTSPPVLRDSYHLDISGFVSELERRGFEVPESARANYVNTVFAVSALMNRRYLDSLTDGFSRDDETLLRIRPQLEDNQTARDLKERGFEFLFFRSSFPFLAHNRLADREIPARVVSEFTAYWLRQTVLASYLDVHCWLAKCRDRQWLAGVSEIDRKIELMASVARTRDDRPRFVFVHLLLPHGPMRLTSTCEARDPVWPSTLQEAADPELRVLYADQVRCTNRKILALVDSLLASSSEPPVIVLQGDHGYGRFPLGRARPLAASTAEQVEDRASVFGAYLLPDTDREEDLFWDGITPVNVMRVVMSTVFGEPFTPLPDLTFWSDWDHPYAFEQVSPQTDRRSTR